MIEILPMIGCSLLRFGDNYDAVISALGVPESQKSSDHCGGVTLVYRKLQIVLNNGMPFTANCRQSELRVMMISCSASDATLFKKKIIGLSYAGFANWNSTLPAQFTDDPEITAAAGWRSLRCAELCLSVDFYLDSLRTVLVDVPYQKIFPEASKT
jgi:hypothetical protein